MHDTSPEYVPFREGFLEKITPELGVERQVSVQLVNGPHSLFLTLRFVA